MFTMELQNIYLSIFYILLPDYLLHLLQMIGIMSSPVHDYYRYASARRPQAATVKETEKPRMLDNPAKDDAASVLLESFRLLLDPNEFVNTVQSVLHQCTSPKPDNTSMAGLQLVSNSASTFCYFFVDMQPHYDFDSCQDSTYKDLADDKHFACGSAAEDTSPSKSQRTISECSDDSFICFEDDNSSVASDTCDETDDNNASDNVAECDDSQDHTKKVRFNLKPNIHVMHTWNFAYRAARKGNWQEFARDRERFQQRIKRVATQIDVILSSDHRERVFKDRFLDIK